MENKVEGPSAVCFTTTKPDVDPETKSRFWVTSIDESRDQTRKILSFQRQQHLSDGLITTPEIEAILRKHRNFQRLLKPLAVKNPYAAQLVLRRRPAAGATRPAEISEPHQGHCLPAATAEGSLLRDTATALPCRTSKPIRKTSRWPTGWPMKSWATRWTNFRAPATICCCNWMKWPRHDMKEQLKENPDSKPRTERSFFQPPRHPGVHRLEQHPAARSPERTGGL